jgi:hypothetical protein
MLLHFIDLFHSKREEKEEKTKEETKEIATTKSSRSRSYQQA